MEGPAVHFTAKNGNRRLISSAFGRRPYSEIMKASAALTAWSTSSFVERCLGYDFSGGGIVAGLGLPAVALHPLSPDKVADFPARLLHLYSSFFRG